MTNGPLVFDDSVSGSSSNLAVPYVSFNTGIPTYIMTAGPNDLMSYGAAGASNSLLYGVTNATWASGVATITTNEASGFQAGQTVTITSVVASGIPTGYNGTFVITGVNTANNTFTCALAANPGAWLSGGSVGQVTTATISGILTGSSTQVISKGGSATLVLSGANQFGPGVREPGHAGRGQLDGPRLAGQRRPGQPGRPTADRRHHRQRPGEHRG